MKITVDVDLTPEELRQFLGLPNVERIQEEVLKNAQKYLKDAGASQYGELVASAMQPMMAYQKWVQGMMSGGRKSNQGDDSEKKTND